MNYSAIDKVTKNKTRSSGMGDFVELQLSKVRPNPEQPRKKFNDEDITDLAIAIESDGLLQPIVVVKRDNFYIIVSGERRYRAHKFLNCLTIKTHIIDVDDSKVLELALIENIQREDLTDFEVAVHIGKLWGSGNYLTKLDLASALGKSRSYLSKTFGCLRLDEMIIKDLEEAKHDIGLSVLEEISRVKDKAMQREVYRMYLSKSITRDGISEYRNLKMESDEAPEVKAKVKKAASKEKPTNVEFTISKNNTHLYKSVQSFCRDIGLRLPVSLEDGANCISKKYKITIEEI